MRVVRSLTGHNLFELRSRFLESFVLCLYTFDYTHVMPSGHVLEDGGCGP